MYDLNNVITVYSDKVPASTTTLYTVPANHILVITSIHLTNNTNFTAAVTLSIGTDILLNHSTCANGQYHYSRKLVLNASDYITGISTLARIGAVINGYLLKKTGAL